MLIYSIYKITNKTNGKSYIGFTKNLERRLKMHQNKARKGKTKFYKAVREFGWNDFECSILYQSLDYDHTWRMEEQFILEYGTNQSGYNTDSGGPNPTRPNPWNKGRPVGETTRSILREKQLAKIKNGTHHFIGSSNPVWNQITEGKNLFYNKEWQKAKGIKSSKNMLERMANGTHPSQQIHTCQHCGKSMGLSNYKRWHGDNCKLNPKV